MEIIKIKFYLYAFGWEFKGGHFISHRKPRGGRTEKGCEETALVLEFESFGPVVMSGEVTASEGKKELDVTAACTELPHAG